MEVGAPHGLCWWALLVHVKIGAEEVGPCWCSQGSAADTKMLLPPTPVPTWISHLVQDMSFRFFICLNRVIYLPPTTQVIIVRMQ